MLYIERTVKGIGPTVAAQNCLAFHNSQACLTTQVLHTQSTLLFGVQKSLIPEIEHFDLPTQLAIWDTTDITQADAYVG